MKYYFFIQFLVNINNFNFSGQLTFSCSGETNFHTTLPVFWFDCYFDQCFHTRNQSFPQALSTKF